MTVKCRWAVASILCALALGGCATMDAGAPPLETQNPLATLMAGNRRFAAGQSYTGAQGVARRDELVGGQHPIAAIVSCSDSRVPPEIVFDQGLGDLFVVRSAGNVIDDHAIGSIEYAVSVLDVPLVVVLGHDACGAVQAAVNGGDAPGHIASIVESIKPAVEDARGQGGDLLNHAINDNATGVAQALRDASQILDAAIASGALTVTAARYHLDGGVVELLPMTPTP